MDGFFIISFFIGSIIFAIIMMCLDDNTDIWVMKEKSNNIRSISNKKKKKQLAKEKIRDYLKPKCEEKLAEEDYPIIKED